MTFDPDIARRLSAGRRHRNRHAALDQRVGVAGAKRGRLTLAETEFRQVGLESSDMAWNLPEVNAGRRRAAPGDAIEDGDGVNWTILSAARSPLSGVWRTVTRRQR